MSGIAPLFFQDMGQMLAEYVVTAACRITDPAFDGRGNENFTVELFAQSFPLENETRKKLDGFLKRMKKLRDKIVQAKVILMKARL